MLSLLTISLCFALMAVTWAVVLVDAGMLLEPVQRWARQWYRTAAFAELDRRWWWKPLWGCERCVAGQLACWGYLVVVWQMGSPYHWHAHLLTVCLSIYLSAILSKIYQWSQS